VFFWAVGPETVTRNVDAIEEDYPAAGVLQPGDRLVAIDGRRGTPGELSERIASHECPGQPTDGCEAGTPARVTVKRAGSERTFELTPVYDANAPTGDEDDPRGRTRLGFGFAEGPRRTLPFGEALDTTVDQFWFITKATLELPLRLIDPVQRKEISGVVGSYETTRQTILDDLEEVIGILAIISLSLAIVNLFPFLPLDGGHIFWAIVEKIRRKPVPFSVMERAGVVGFMLVILIFLVGLSNDIDRLSGEGFQVR
jgi:regulator of sigma E protease